jgi:fatty acid desaturase
MVAACVRRWLKEYGGLGESLRTIAMSFGIVAVYYGILVFWFWQMIPGTVTLNE